MFFGTRQEPARVQFRYVSTEKKCRWAPKNFACILRLAPMYVKVVVLVVSGDLDCFMEVRIRKANYKLALTKLCFNSL